MTNRSNLGGTFTFPGTSITIARMGYGAMQLAGREGNKMVWGQPRDVPGAIAVALAWLLHRSPNVLLIPGTSSVAHLRENLGAAKLQLSPEVIVELDAIGMEKSL